MIHSPKDRVDLGMTHLRKVAHLAAALLALVLPDAAAACPAPQPAEIVLASWRAACAHPLCARIYATDPKSRFRQPDAAETSCGRTSDILAAMSGPAQGGVLVLGEAHDNPEHHKFQAALVDGSAAVVMEQIRAEQQPGLDRFREFEINARRLATVADLKQFLDWEKSGWAKYDYDPLLHAIIAAKRPIYAGDPPRTMIKQLAKDGPSALPPDEQRRLALDIPLGDALDAASAVEIEEAHCGLLPKMVVPNMAFAQRYRDAHLADATLKAADAHGSAILITGNIHARTDRGVPWYIRNRAPERNLISVMLIEVEDGRTDPEAYIPRDPGGRPAADYIVFTPAAKHDNPCAEATDKAKKPAAP